MDVLDAIATRRTTKSYAPDEIPAAQLQRILEAARWAPCHRLTFPWRLRVLGPEARGRLKVAAGPGADKLDRAPTLIVASCMPSPLPLHAAEDVQATACAIYAVLLAAHAEGIASYWRTPGVLRTPAGRQAVGVGDGEQILGLLHLGVAEGEPADPVDRPLVSTFVEMLP